MEYLAFLVALVLCTRGKPSTGIGRPRNGVTSLITTTSSTISAVINPADTLGIWFGVSNKTGTVTLKMCNFPFTYRDIEYKDCIRMNSDNVLWCRIKSEHLNRILYGICTKVIQRKPADQLPITYYFNTTASIASAGGTCYRYIPLSGTRPYFGIWYVQLKTIEHCKLHCNTISICRGINFSRKGKLCYIILDTMVKIIPDEEFLHYNRSTCKTNYVISTTSMNTQSTTVYHCIDELIMKFHTTAAGGIHFKNVTTIERCKQICLSFRIRDTEDFCVGLDFDETEKPYKCFLSTNQSEFNITYSVTNIYHYTRQECTAGFY